jgi:hypothetical protein
MVVIDLKSLSQKLQGMIETVSPSESRDWNRFAPKPVYVHFR